MLHLFYNNIKKKSIEEIEEVLNKDAINFVVEALRDKKITREQVKLVLERIVKGEGMEKAVEFNKQEDNVEEAILDLIKNN